MFYGLHPVFDVLIYKMHGHKRVDFEGRVRDYPDEWTDEISLRSDVYLCVLPSAEDADGLPLRIEFLLTLRIVSPYRSRFGTHHWLDATVNRFQAVLRDLIAQDPYEVLLRQRSTLGGEGYAFFVKDRYLLINTWKRNWRYTALWLGKPPELLHLFGSLTLYSALFDKRRIRRTAYKKYSTQT